MKRVFCLLLLMMTVCTAAAAITWPADLQVIEEEAFSGDASLTGTLILPEGLLRVGKRAFASTGLHALVMPSSVQVVESGVLDGAPAAYLRVKSTTVIENDPGCPYVFGPAAFQQAASYEYVPESLLLMHDGFYYRTDGGFADLLCAVSGGQTGQVTIPKVVDGRIVRSVSEAVSIGTQGLTFRIPAYLSQSTGIAHQVYQTMTAEITLPVAAYADAPVALEAKLEGAYGDAAYEWRFTPPSGGEAIVLSTEEARCSADLNAVGTWKICLTATDALGDTAQAEAFVNVAANYGDVVYRAYLVGNTYAGTSSYLPGPDHDVASMRKMLNSMTGSDYAVRISLDASAESILSNIRSAFADADPNDVSLFYFSGHGASGGYLVGMNNTYISPARLRSTLDLIPGEKIVLVDSCHSGQIIGKSSDSGTPASFNSALISAFSWKSKGADDLAAGGYHVITACGGSQLSSSLSSGSISFGAFTYALLYGSGYDSWEGRSRAMTADTNGDGAITLAECKPAVAERISYLRTLVGTLEQEYRTYSDNSNMVFWFK